MDQTAGKTVSAATSELICPKCKARISAEYTVCDFCGSSLAEAQRSAVKSKTYICPTCNKVLESICGDAKRGFLCPSGHKVQDAPTVGFPGSVVGGVIGGVVIWFVTWYVPGLFPSLTALSGIFRVVFTGYALFKVAQGFLYLTKPAPTKRLAYHFLGLYLGALVGFGIGAAMFYYRG
jgi:hypothetical protein